MAAEETDLATRRIVPLAVVAALLLAAAPAPRKLQRWEHGGIQLEVNRVRSLAQRLSKQNMLRQLNLAGIQRSDLIETAGMVDASLTVLLQGSPGLSVPAPLTLEIREELERLDKAWGGLRRVAVASSYEYVRGAAERGAADPLGIHYFDQLAAGVDAQAARVSNAYVALCEAQGGGQDCRAVQAATGSGMVSERMMKELVLLVSGIDAAANTKRLAESRAGLDRTLLRVSEQEAVQATISEERGKRGLVAASMWREVEENWGALRPQIDSAIAGDREAIDLAAALDQQQDLLAELQRLSVAVRRFAAARRAQGWRPSSS